MSLAYTVIKCDGPNGVEGRRCAALLTIPGSTDSTKFLTSLGWLGIMKPDAPVTHHCPGCHPTDPGTLPVAAL